MVLQWHHGKLKRFSIGSGFKNLVQGDTTHLNTPDGINSVTIKWDREKFDMEKKSSIWFWLSYKVMGRHLADFKFSSTYYVLLS